MSRRNNQSQFEYTEEPLDDLIPNVPKPNATRDGRPLPNSRPMAVGFEDNELPPGVNILPPTAPRPIGTIPFTQLPVTVQIELKRNVVTAPVRGIELPDNFDARERWPGMITPPMDQTTCGSCWAFATSTILSDRGRIASTAAGTQNEEGYADLFRTIDTYFPYAPNPEGSYGPILNNLSPYQMVSCNLCNSLQQSNPVTTEFLDGPEDICNFGCDGGIIKYAMDYLKRIGLNNLVDTNPPASNPGDPSTFACDFDPNKPVYRARDIYAVISPDDSETTRIRKIKEEIFIHGPVAVSYMVYPSWQAFFQNEQTKRGVYTANDQDGSIDTEGGGHAVAIIGWGKTSEGIDYWIIRNSWGIGWGDGGYFRMQANLFGILDDVWGFRF